MNNRETVQMRRSAGALAADQSGAVLIEFAMVALPFFALMLAIVQTSLIYFAQEALETAVESAARNLVTGKTQSADATGAASGMSSAQLAERFRLTGCAALPSFMSCSRLYAEVRSAPDWTSLDTSKPSTATDANGRLSSTMSYSVGAQGAVVMIRLMYLWPVQADGLLRLSNASRQQRLIYATSVAKSESYS